MSHVDPRVSDSPDRSFPRGWLIGGDVGRWLLLGTAAGQAAAPGLIPFDATAQDPPVVPAGYTFGIWGLILVGCLASAVHGLPSARAASPAYRAVQLRLSVVQVLFVGWLLAAGSSAVWLTVPIFAVILVLTLTGLSRVLAAAGGPRGDSAGRGQPSDPWTRRLLGGTLAIYAGWSTAAVWVNLASLLPAAGLSAAGPVGTLWQSAFLVAACAAAVLAVRALGAYLPYVLAVAWAFIGIVVSALSAGQGALAGVAITGLLILTVATATTLRRVSIPNAGAHGGT